MGSGWDENFLCLVSPVGEQTSPCSWGCLLGPALGKTIIGLQRGSLWFIPGLASKKDIRTVGAELE